MSAPKGLADVLSGMARVAAGLAAERRSQRRGALEERLSSRLGQLALLRALLAGSPSDPAWLSLRTEC